MISGSGSLFSPEMWTFTSRLSRSAPSITRSVHRNNDKKERDHICTSKLGSPLHVSRWVSQYTKLARTVSLEPPDLLCISRRRGSNDSIDSSNHSSVSDTSSARNLIFRQWGASMWRRKPNRRSPARYLSSIVRRWEERSDGLKMYPVLAIALTRVLGTLGRGWRQVCRGSDP